MNFRWTMYSKYFFSEYKCYMFWNSHLTGRVVFWIATPGTLLLSNTRQAAALTETIRPFLRRHAGLLFAGVMHEEERSLFNKHGWSSARLSINRFHNGHIYLLPMTGCSLGPKSTPLIMEANAQCSGMTWGRNSICFKRIASIQFNQLHCVRCLMCLFHVWLLEGCLTNWFKGISHFTLHFS